MIYVDCDLFEWTKKHKIQVVKCICPTCGLEQETTVPVVTSKSYGLVTPPHRCNDPREGYTFVGKNQYREITSRALALF